MIIIIILLISRSLIHLHYSSTPLCVPHILCARERSCADASQGQAKENTRKPCPQMMDLCSWRKEGFHGDVIIIALSISNFSGEISVIIERHRVQLNVISYKTVN